MKGILKSRRGNEFVEAAVAIPLITAAVLLILNLFVCYLHILATGVKDHKEACRRWDSDREAVIKVYRKSESVRMAPAGILRTRPECRLEIRSYEFNEDLLVRAKEVLHEE